MKTFASLTPRGQILRLRRMALTALQHYDLEVTQIRLLTNHLNAVFRVDTADHKKYALRISLPGQRTLPEIRSELMWLAALRRDTPLIVPKPRHNNSGDLVTIADTPGIPQPRPCVVFGWVFGPNLVMHLSTPTMKKFGSLMAQLHNQAETFEPPAEFALNPMRKSLPFNEPEVIFSEEYRHLFPPARRDIFQQVVDRVQLVIDRLYARPDKPFVIHADLHQWNVKLWHGNLHPLDFDDCMIGYPVQDIATTFYYICGHGHYPTYVEAFKQGYTSLRPWPEEYPGQIETLIAGRSLVMVNFLVQNIAPEYRHTTPGFVDRTEAVLRDFLNHQFPTSL